MENATCFAFCTLIAIATFLCWEVVAWFSHKYIMHGFLWSLHRSHHTVHKHFFERNDWFVVLFSIPAIGLFYYYTLVRFNPYMIAVATGITGYGIFYVIVHDILIHQRLRWKPKVKNKYLKRLIHAHYIHHRKHTRDGCEAFGFLYAPEKYQPTDPPTPARLHPQP